MIRVVGIDKDGFPRDLGIKEGTIEEIEAVLDSMGFTILSIKEEE